MKLHLPLGGFKVVFLFALIFLGIKDGFGQCPTAPTANPAGYLVTANSATGFTVGAGQTLVIQSGTYTGNIGGLNKTGVIYVAAGATFNPGNINSPAGKIINCGTASIPSFDIPTTAVGDSLFILNYNVMTLTGTYNTNGNNSSWLNGLGSKMTFTQSVTNFRDVTFINNGYVLVNGSFNTGAVTAPHRNSFINHDSITVTGDIVLDAAIKNDGFFFSIGNMTLNSGGNINNGCFFETDKAFNYSSSDTLFVTGLTWVDKAGGGGVAKFQGKYVKVLGNGFIQGSDFENNSTYFEGDGNLYFSGATKNQGGAAGAFGILSTASYHLNFYDATPTGTLYFDTQGNNPNALVTKSSIPAKNNTYVPGTCSDIIKGNFCKLSGNKPNAGSDVTICSAATTTALSGGSSTKNWSVLSGAAAITSQTGTVTGMAMYTSYQFILTDNSNAAKCTDTVKVTKITPPTVAAGANLSACASASPGRITLAGRSFGGSASSAAWSILSGGGALNNTLQTSRPDTVKYTPASNFSGTVKLRLYSNVPTNCTVASDTLDIEVSPRPTAVITGNQIICSGTATGNISIALTGSQPWSLTYSDGTTPISKTGITSSPYTFTVSPTSTKTYTVTALSDAKCAAIVGDMTGGAIISVDPTSVGGTVTSSKNVCRGANSGTLTLGGQVGNVLRWESSTNNFGAVTTIVNTTTSEVYTNLNATTEYRAVVKSGTCSPANSAPAKLTIIPDPNTVNPVITASPTAVCEGGIVTVKITNTENGVKYYVKDNGTKIDSIIGNGLTVSKGVSMPIVGISRTLTFTASRGGCVEIPLGGSIAIRVDAGSNTNLTVTANPSTICVGGTTSITVFAAEPNVSYQLTDLGNPISGSVVGTGANIIFGPISGLAAGTHNLIVKATTAGCGTVNLSPPPVVVVNPDPGSTNPGFTDTTVCSNATNVKINITNSISGVTYTFKLGAAVVGTVTANGSTASLVIPIASLSPTANVITTRSLDVTGSIAQCTSVIFTDKSVITINPNLSASGPSFTDTTVCSNAGNVKINITNAISGVTYTFKLGATVVGTVTASGTTASIIIPITSLSPAANVISTRTLDVSGSITNCSVVDFNDKSVIIINPTISAAGPTFTDTTVCSNAGNVKINITNAISGVTYTFKLGAAVVGTVTASGTTASLVISIASLNPTANIITTRSLDVTGSITNCNAVLFNDKSVITINPNLTASGPSFTDTTVCSNAGNVKINITNAIAGVTYTFKFGATVVGTVTASGTTASLLIPIASLNPTINLITTRSVDVSGSITNCNVVDFTDKSVITINPNLSASGPSFTDTTVCSNTANVKINISNAISGVTYTFKLGAVVVGTVTASGTTANLIISVASLNPTSNLITTRSLDVTGSITNCNAVLFNDKSVITINPLPLSTVITVGDTICATDVNADIIITNAQANVTYEVFTSGPVLATGSIGTNGLLTILLPRAGNLNTGDNTVNIRAVFLPCSQVGLSPVNVKVNPLPSATSSISAAPPVVCAGGLSTVSIGTSTAGATYKIYDNGALTDSILSVGGNITKEVKMKTVGVRIITVKAFIKGCGVVDLTNKDTITVLNGNNINLPVTATDTICTGSTVTVKVQNSELLVDYQVVENATPLSTVQTGTGGTLTYLINGLSVGSHTLKVSAKTVCGLVYLNTEPIVIVNGIPTATLVVKGDTLCLPSSADSMVTIFAAQAGVTYKAYVAGQLAGQGKGTGANLKFAINRSKLSVGNNYIKFTATNTGCTVVNLKDSANMRVNTPPNLALQVISDTVCSIPATNPVLKIVNAQDQVKYKAYYGIDSVGVANGPADSLPISINVGKLVLGDNAIKFTATINGCGLFNITTTANARINTPPKVDLIVTNDTVCTIGGKAPVLIIKSAEKGVIYKAYKGAALLGSGIGTNADLILAINKVLLASGDNAIRIEAERAPCTVLSFPANANIRVNTQPSNASNVTAIPAILCVGQKTKVTITNTTLNAKYIVYDNADSVGAVIAKGTSATVDVSMNVKGDRIIKVKAIIGGCDTVFLTKTAPVRVNDGADINLNVVYDSVICFGGTSKVTIQKTEVNTIYEVFENSISLSSKITGTGKDTSFIISGLGIGNHTLTIRSTIGGCGDADLVKKPLIVVQGSPNVGLTVIGDTLCNPSTADSLVTIKTSQLGVSYTAFLNGTVQVGQGVGTGSDLRFTIYRALLANGDNKIEFTAKNQGCAVVKLNKPANMRVNLPPNINLSVLGDTVCSQPVVNPVVRVLSAEEQVSYTAFLNTILVGSGTGPQTSLGISIDNTKLSPGNNTIRFVATINGCPVADLLKKANARINNPADLNAVISNDTICTLGGANSRIVVKNSELDVIYRALNSGVEVGKGKGSGLDLPLIIDKTILSPGDNPIVIEMTAFKCAAGLVNRNIRVNTIPNSKLTVIDTIVCTNSPATHVGIEGTTDGITYSAFENGIIKGSPKLSKGGRLNIPINIGNGINELKASQNIHNLIVKAFIPGCDTILEGDTAVIKINQLPSDSLTITGSAGCGDAKVSVANTTAGVSYQAFKGNTSVNTAVKSTGGILVLSIPAANLGIGTHIINVSASIDGCAIVNLIDTASVTVKEVPSGTLEVTGSTVCTNSPNAIVTVEGTKTGEEYQAYVNNAAIGIPVISTKPNIQLILPVKDLTEGNNIVNVRSKLPGCGETTLLDTGLVIINKRPDSTRTVTGSTVCSNSPSGQIYIDNSKATEVYKVYEGKVSKGIAKAGNGGRLEIEIPIGLTSDALDNKVEDHFLNVIALIPGCDTVRISQKGLVKISQQPDSNLIATGSVGCGGNADLTVTVSGTKNREVYQAYLDTVKVGNPVTSTGGDVVLRLPVNSLNVGKNIINVSAFITGCANVKLKDTALVVVNTDLANDLTVIGDTVCSDSKTAFLTILQTKAGEKYIFEFKGQSARRDTVSPGGSFKVPIPVNVLSIGLDSLVLKSQNPGCGVALLTNPGLILVNGKPDDGLGLDGDIVCSNGTSAQITIAKTRNGESYYAYHKGNLVDSVLSNGNGIVFNIPVNVLSVGINKINAKVYIKGCGTLDLKDTAQVLVNPLPSDTLSVTGDTVCIGNKIVSVTIEGTRFNERYQAYENGKLVGGEKLSAGGKLILNLPLGGSTGLGEGYHKIEIKSTIDSCTVVDLKDWADVFINTSPDSNLTVIGDIVCSNGDSATVQILGTRKGEIYKAELNGSSVSQEVTSNGGAVALRIPVSVLSPDTNLVNIFARVVGAGCPDITLDNQAKVVLNGLPIATLKVSGDTVCSSGNQAFAKVKIFNTTKSVTYTAYSNGGMLGQPIISKGDTVVITIPIDQLKPDLNIVNFIATIDSCANVNLTDSAYVLKNLLPPITSDVEGSIVCSNEANGTVTIKNSALNALYVAKSGSTQIGSSITGTGSDITILLPVNQLKPDTNIITIEVSIKGCGTQTLEKKAQVIVNPKPSADLNTEGDVVCETSPSANVKIELTQRNVSYQAYYKGQKIGSPMVSIGNTVNLTIPVPGLTEIENKISVKASINKCEDVDLKDTALVVVNRVPRAGSVKITGSSICPGDDGEITMSGGDLNVVYNVLVNGETTPFSFKGNSPETKITIPASLLPKYTNSVSLRANIPSCEPKDIGDGASIYVLSKRLKISGKTLLCDSSISDYITDTILGALSYKWTVTEDARIISAFDTASSIKVRFGTQSPLISVVPMATKRTCPLAGDTMKVNIEPFVRGNGFISSKDTVCLNAIDSVFAGGLTGVSSYKWIWSDSVDVLGITKRTKKDSIQYVEPGMVTLKALAYSNCAVAYVDTIIKHVRVLSTPHVEANEYDITPMRGTMNIINLNGSGTSVTSGRDTISYKWYTDKSTPGQVINPKSLYDATVIPAGKETKVFLLASNINGYCPAKDSAIINLTFKLDIPNVFTPNGDGVHDTWEIKNINIFFSNCTVEVFNKWGSFVYKSAEGYAEPWDGTRNGEDLPVATYYYIVDLKDGNRPYTGSVTIIR